MAPNRRGDIARLGLSSTCRFLANLMSATIAGLFISLGGAVLYLKSTPRLVRGVVLYGKRKRLRYLKILTRLYSHFYRGLNYANSTY